jgi:hypothetical protein
MSPSPIIETFDVIKGAAPGLHSCLKGPTINTFTFETMKEAFHRCIIIAVSSTAHTHSHDFLLWLKETRSGEKQRREPLEMIAHVISWAIFGTALQWSQEVLTVSLEEMADVISQVIMEGVARLIPDAVSEQ